MAPSKFALKRASPNSHMHMLPRAFAAVAELTRPLA
jgi:hypothetical protein